MSDQERIDRLWKGIIQVHLMLEDTNPEVGANFQNDKDVAVAVWKIVDCTMTSTEWEHLVNLVKEVRKDGR